MEGEDVCFCYFYWFGRINPLPTYPLKRDQNHVVHLKNFFWWVVLFLMILKKGFKKEIRGLKAWERKIMWGWFNFLIMKRKSKMRIKFIKHLIKKIKGKRSLGCFQGLLRKYFWSFDYLIFLKFGFSKLSIN